MGVHRVIQRGDAEVGFHGVRQTPGQDLARRPVDDGDEIEKAPPHRDIGHVGAPDVVGPFNHELPQQIGIRLVRGMRLARPRLIDRRKADLAHQPADALASDRPSKAAKMANHLARAVERAFQKCLVDKPHEGERFRAFAGRRPIERGARDRRQFALADNREPWMTWIDHVPPPIKAQRSKAFAKKSRSTTSCPILACSFVTSASRRAAGSRALSSNTRASFSIA